jgi:hypothetical protein
MNLLKGFIVIADLASNASNVVAQFGELSPRSKTFSREVGLYNDDAYPEVALHSFFSKTDVGVHVVLPPAVVNHVLNMASYINDRYVASTIPANASKATFIGDIETEFGAAVANVEIGALVAHLVTSGKNMPDYVSWTHADTGTSTDYDIKVWFIDASFQDQYTDFEIIVIPPVNTITLPIDSIDDLYNDTAVVGPLLAEVTIPIHSQMISAAMGNKPYTILTTATYTWHDPNLPLSTRPLHWTLLIYGQAGDNADNIRDAIQQYITDNTALTGGDWIAMLPDLYAVTEFTIIPLWENEAVPPGLDYGIYSPAANPGLMKAVAVEHTPPTYNDVYNLSNHLDTHLAVASTYYRSLAFLMIGNPINTGGIVSMFLKYPDYMNAPASTLDFYRMQVTTQDFVLMLVDMLEKAATLTPAGLTPAGYSKITRSGKLYLAKTLLDTQFLVLSKQSYVP